MNEEGEVVYLDSFIEFLEKNGIPRSMLTIVDDSENDELGEVKE